MQGCHRHHYASPVSPAVNIIIMTTHSQHHQRSPTWNAYQKEKEETSYWQDQPSMITMMMITRMTMMMMTMLMMVMMNRLCSCASHSSLARGRRICVLETQHDPKAVPAAQAVMPEWPAYVAHGRLLKDPSLPGTHCHRESCYMQERHLFRATVES